MGPVLPPGASSPVWRPHSEWQVLPSLPRWEPPLGSVGYDSSGPMRAQVTGSPGMHGCPATGVREEAGFRIRNAGTAAPIPDSEASVRALAPGSLGKRLPVIILKVITLAGVSSMSVMESVWRA